MRPRVDYEQHGRTYARHRRPDPRIAARIHAALGDARTVRERRRGRRLLRAGRPLGARGRAERDDARPAAAAARRRPSTDARSRSRSTTTRSTPRWRASRSTTGTRSRTACASCAASRAGRSSCSPSISTACPPGNRTTSPPAWRSSARASRAWRTSPRRSAAGRASRRSRPPPTAQDGFFEAFWNRPEAMLDPAVRGVAVDVGAAAAGRRGADRRAARRRPGERRVGRRARAPARAQRARRLAALVVSEPAAQGEEIGFATAVHSGPNSALALAVTRDERGVGVAARLEPALRVGHQDAVAERPLRCRRRGSADDRDVEQGVRRQMLTADLDAVDLLAERDRAALRRASAAASAWPTRRAHRQARSPPRPRRGRLRSASDLRDLDARLPLRSARDLMPRADAEPSSPKPGASTRR